MVFGFFGHTLLHAGSQFPDQGSNLCPLHWEHRVLTTGPPGKSQSQTFLVMSFKSLKNTENFKINEMISTVIHAVKRLRSEDRKITKNAKCREVVPASAVWSEMVSLLKDPSTCTQWGEGPCGTEETSLPDKGKTKCKASFGASVPGVWQPTWQRKQTVHLLPP